MLRTALLGGNSITLDADLSKHIETLTEQGIIEGFEVSQNSVAPGKAWVKATRANGETIMVLVQNTQSQSISLSGDVFVGIELDQNAINNGSLNNEDGTGIASIKVSPSKPSQNYLVLAIRQGGRLTDQRVIIPKIQSLSQRTGTLEQKMQTQERKVERLEEAGTPQYLGKFLTVGESYSAGEVMYEEGGKIRKKFIKQNIADVNHSGSYGTHNVGEYNPESGESVYVEIDRAEGAADKRGVLYFASAYMNSSGFAPSGAKIYGSINLGEGIATNLKVQLTGYTGGPICVSWHYNSTSGNMRINGMKFVTRKSSAMSLYPREVKRVNEKVECTLIGIHSNGMAILPQLEELPINATIQGVATGIWNAPANGWLEVKRENRGGSSNARCKINDEKLPYNENGRTTLFVKKGAISLETWIKTGNVSKLVVEKFISIL